jgi:hypothetical protein
VKLQICPRAKVIAGLVGSSEAGERHAAKIVRPRIAAAALDRRIERIKRLPEVLREKRMDAATVKLFEQRVLAE